LAYDQGTEVKSNAYEDWARVKGVATNYTCTQAKNQLHKAERLHAVLSDMERATRALSGLPAQYWSFVRHAAALVHDMVSLNPSRTKTAYEAYWRAKPDFKRLRAIGCVRTRATELGQRTMRSAKAIFLGYSRTKPGYVVLHLTTAKILDGDRDVVCCEHTFPFVLARDRLNMRSLGDS
jgi:hypothetical protein